MIQVIKYKCCGKIFAACREPECYTDIDWQRNLRKDVRLGHTVEMIPNGTMQFGKCECKKVTSPQIPDLFTQINNL